MKPANYLGFSMVEMIVTITIMSIISGLCYFSICNAEKNAIEAAAKVKAHILNSAKLSCKITSDDARKFNRQPSDEAKYKVLQQFMPMSDDNLERYAGNKCKFKLGDLDQRVRLFIDGKEVEY